MPAPGSASTKVDYAYSSITPFKTNNPLKMHLVRNYNSPRHGYTLPLTCPSPVATRSCRRSRSGRRPCAAARRGRLDSALLFGRKLEHVAHHQLDMVSVIALVLRRHVKAFQYPPRPACIPSKEP